MKATKTEAQCKNEPFGVLEGAESLAGGAHAARLARELVDDCAAIVRDFAQARLTLLQSGRDAHDSAGRRVGRRRLDEEVEEFGEERFDPHGVAVSGRKQNFGHEILESNRRFGDTRIRLTCYIRLMGAGVTG